MFANRTLPHRPRSPYLKSIIDVIPSKQDFQHQKSKLNEKITNLEKLSGPETTKAQRERYQYNILKQRSPEIKKNDSSTIDQAYTRYIQSKIRSPSNRFRLICDADSRVNRQ